MDLWQARKKSLEWLATDLVEQDSLVNKGFELLDKCIALLNEKSKDLRDTTDGKFARVVNITLAKARNLLLGSYSMLLDAVAQEAGALLRLILEAYELLIYFRLEPSRVDKAIDGNLPSPGKIAKIIEGQFKDLRDTLSMNASHISFTGESSSHLLDHKTFEVKSIQIQSISVFKTNLSTLNAMQLLIVAEAIRCLSVVGYNEESLLNEYDTWRTKSLEASLLP